MIDFATLAIRIDSAPVDKLTASLDRSAAAAMRTEKAVGGIQRGFLQYGAATGATSRVAREIDMMGGAAEKAHLGLGKLERGLGSLAARSLGVEGPMAKIGEAILGFGIEGPLMVGALAGTAALGFAFEKMAEEGRKAADELVKAREHADKLLQTPAGESQAVKGVLAEHQTTLEKELQYRYALLETAVRADNAEVIRFQQERIADILTEQNKDNVRIASEQKAVDTAHRESLDAALEKQKKFNDVIREAMKITAEVSKELTGWAEASVKAAEAAYKWKLNWTDGAKHLQDLGFMAKPGEGDALINNYMATITPAWTETVHKISESEKELVNAIQHDFADLFDGIATDGLSSFTNLFDGIRRGFIKLAADLAAQKIMSQIVTTDTNGAITGLTAQGAQSILPVAVIVSAFSIMSNAIMGAAQAARKAAQEARALQEAWDTSIERRRADLGGGNSFDRQRADAMADRSALYKQAQETFAKNLSGLANAYAEIDDVIFKQIEQITAAQRLMNDQMREDYNVRALRAQRRNEEADALAFQIAQEREYQEAQKAGADEVTLARLREVQAMEAQQRAIDQQIEGRQKEADAAQEALARTTETVQALRNFATQLRIGNASPWGSIDLAKKEFDRVAGLARNGDQAAAGRLPQLAQQYLDYSRQYNASGAGYQRDLNYVLGIIDSLGDKYDVQRNLEQEQVDVLNAILRQLQQPNLGEGHRPPIGGGIEANGGIYIQPQAPGGDSIPILQAGFSAVVKKLGDLEASLDGVQVQIRRGADGLNLRV
jgi:hypothetical protein